MSESQLFEAIKCFDQQDVRSLFDTLNGSIDTIVDPQNATILHVASNYNNHEVVKYFLQQYQQYSIKIPEKYNIERKKKWINKKDKEGFTCLHYAAFRGNILMSIFLQEHGSDIYAINSQGLNVLHIAAQGDCPALIYYYLNKGMKISSQDSKGSTPLHWACYSGQENSAAALMAWGAEMDKADFTYGMTPLHLAVVSGNGRIVKRLLVRGCDRNLKNYAGRLPLDIALEGQYKNITKMIIDKQGIQEFFNLKSPFRKVGKITFPFYFVIILFLINFLLNISFVIFTNFPENGDLTVAYLIMGFFVALIFIIVWKKQPGFIASDINQNDFSMLKNNPADKICYDCMLLKPERSRHCQICNKCVSVYDHHCPWVANCIGSKNFLWFYIFLLSMELFIIFTIVLQSQNIVDYNWDSHSGLQTIRLICIIFSFICSCAFIIPLSYLLIVQTRNCLSNQTTFQRYGFQTKRQPSQNYSDSDNLRENLMKKQEDMSQQRSVGSRLQVVNQMRPLRNCYLMCIGNGNNLVYQIGKIR